MYPLEVFADNRGKLFYMLKKVTGLYN